MAENQNQTDRRFSQTVGAPTEVEPVNNDSAVLRLHSRADPSGNRHNWVRLWRPAPADFLIGLRSPLAQGRRAPTADARWSSLNTSGSALIRSQRANLHDRRRLPDVNQNLCRWRIA